MNYQQSGVCSGAYGTEKLVKSSAFWSLVYVALFWGRVVGEVFFFGMAILWKQKAVQRF